MQSTCFCLSPQTNCAVPLQLAWDKSGHAIKWLDDLSSEWGFQPIGFIQNQQEKSYWISKEEAKPACLKDSKEVGLKNVQSSKNLEDQGKYPKITRTTAKKFPVKKMSCSLLDNKKKVTTKSLLSNSTPSYSMVGWKTEVTLQSSSSASATEE